MDSVWSHLVSPVQDTRGLFPTQSVPVGGAVFQLQAELITAVTPPVDRATQSISESLNTEILPKQRDGLLCKEAQANLSENT